MNIVCAGESLELCGERAIHWAARRTLIVADTHFGKDEIFRGAGLSIPPGISAHDLARISALIARFGAERLLVLGDFFHGSPRRSLEFQAAFERWLETHARLQVAVAAGNHDRHGGRGMWAQRLSWHHTIMEQPFAFTHQGFDHPDAYVLSGHVHPVLRLQSRSGDRARVPVFWFGARQAVLPSFGSFTGGAPIKPQRHDRVYAVADAEVFEIQAGID